MNPNLEKLPDRIRSKIRLLENGCWLWTGATNGGYGIISINRKTTRLSRHILTIFGRDPGPLYALHTCDNPPCCNPDHLYGGTPSRNRKDVIARNRQNLPVGCDHYNARLTEDQVRQIRAQYADPSVRLKDIAVQFGMSVSGTHHVATGASWKHVPMAVA